MPNRKPRKPSLATVAKAAGVSTAVVSLVLSGRSSDYRLSEATGQRVRAAAAAQGYARAARRRSQPRLHIVHLADLFGMDARGLGGAILNPLLERLAALGWLTSVDPRLPEHPHAAGQALFVANAMLVPCNLGFEVKTLALVAAAAAHGVRPVVVGRHLDGTDAIQVDGDQAGGTRAIAEHLRSLGHRRVAIVAGVTGDPHSDARVAGIRAVFPGLAAADLWGDGGYSVAGAHRLVGARLAAGARPSAICCCNDRMALGALLALREAGLAVPRQVSVTGFDDHAEFSLVDPGLTTVRLDADGVGGQVADLLAAGGPIAAQRLTIPARLVLRGSTAPVNGA